MDQSRWSASSSLEESGWHPPLSYSQPPITRPEEIQIVLLGAPRTGKTRLQSRYTLRQFVDIKAEHAQRMGAHKHIRLSDGTDVHLIIHEIRAGPGRRTRDWAHQERGRRKRLLQGSDAVMLVFNPWSEETFDWVNDKIIEDILYTGRKNQLSHGVVRLLDGFAATTPSKTKRHSSGRSARSFGSTVKTLPRRPNEYDDGDSEAPLFSDGEEKQDDQIDFRGELRRISMVVERSALKKASLVLNEKDVPSPLPQRRTSVPPDFSSPDGNLATIREGAEGFGSSNAVAVLVDKRRSLAIRRDSVRSFWSVSSTYSQISSTAVSTRHHSDIYSETHPMLRKDDNFADTISEGTTEASLERIPSTLSRTPSEGIQMPVLVVATQTDMLKDRGGNMERQVTAEQGQKLARKFGPNGAYIETSSRTNANVDEAYGIIVEQVMAKRQAVRRDELARERIAAARETAAGGRTATRLKMPKSVTRSCMPQWAFLDAVVEKVSAFFGRPDAEDAVSVETKEDIFGEKVEVRRSRMPGGGVRHSLRQSKLVEREKAERILNRRTMSHETARDSSLNTIIEGTESAHVEAMKRDLITATPALLEAAHNSFEKDELKKPENMVTFKTLEESKEPVQLKEQRSFIEQILATLAPKPSSLPLRRASSTKDQPQPELTQRNRRDEELQVSRVSDYAPKLPPLDFDGVVFDEKRASVAFFMRSVGPEREGRIARYLSHNAVRDSDLTLVSSTAAMRMRTSSRASAVMSAMSSSKGWARMSVGRIPSIPAVPRSDGSGEKDTRVGASAEGRRESLIVLDSIKTPSTAPAAKTTTHTAESTALPSPPKPTVFTVPRKALRTSLAPPPLQLVPQKEPMSPTPPPVPEKTPRVYNFPSRNKAVQPIITTVEVRAS